ncbi:Transmembrane Channel-Like Protein 5 [Manis pentadactyla]|nr:Transmembrane Channel-Like Protein 5 [Manis pentadactyla]
MPWPFNMSCEPAIDLRQASAAMQSEEKVRETRNEQGGVIYKEGSLCIVVAKVQKALGILRYCLNILISD